MSAHWTEKEWRQHIDNRRKHSALWQLIHALGSLRLAMVLLFTILIACAVATVYESKFTAQVAQAYVYKAPWFIFWLAVLCINLFCVTLTRWPWRPRHWGFVITHYGIIVLLVGAAIGQKKGFEANITLRVNDTPTRDLVINRTILQVQGGREDVAYKIPFDVAVKPPTVERPRRVRLPNNPLRLSVESYSLLDEVPYLTASPIRQQGSGVSLEFASGMMAQSVPVHLVRNPEEKSHSDFFGRAHIDLLESLPDRSGAQPPASEIKETQLVLAKAESLISPREDTPSGYRFSLVVPENGTAGGDNGPQVTVEIPGPPSPGGPTSRKQSYPLADLLGKPATLPGESLEFLVRDYWPDMEIKDGRPTSRSEEPNNPAILVVLSGPEGHDQPLLELAVVEEEGGPRLAYQMSRHGVVTASGKVAQGESFQLGWADWKATATAVLPSALLNNRLVPIEGDPATSERGVPGILARLQGPDGETGEAQWIPSGRGITLRLGDESAFVGFGLEVYKLPFTVQLTNFEVPRDPGSTQPSDFLSSVRFVDPARDFTQDSLVHMNHPASFPEGLWRTVLGQNFKFSQARWNSQDLEETTLQVLHDPGWPGKWLGSLAICIGIAIMFYGPKGGSSRKKTGKNRSARNEETEETEETTAA